MKFLVLENNIAAIGEHTEVDGLLMFADVAIPKIFLDEVPYEFVEMETVPDDFSSATYLYENGQLVPKPAPQVQDQPTPVQEQ